MHDNQALWGHVEDADQLRRLAVLGELSSDERQGIRRHCTRSRDLKLLEWGVRDESDTGHLIRAEVDFLHASGNRHVTKTRTSDRPSHPRSTGWRCPALRDLFSADQELRNADPNLRVGGYSVDWRVRPVVSGSAAQASRP